MNSCCMLKFSLNWLMDIFPLFNIIIWNGQQIINTKRPCARCLLYFYCIGCVMDGERIGLIIVCDLGLRLGQKNSIRGRNVFF
jgi:hypothetical protein